MGRWCVWPALWAVAVCAALAEEPAGPDMEEYPREVEIEPGAEVSIDLWRGSLDLTRRRGGALRLEVVRERTQDAACQVLSVTPAAGGRIDIRSAPTGEALCTERLRLALGIPDGVRLRAVLGDGEVRLDSINGEVEVVALGGAVRATGGGGSLQLRTQAGEIQVQESSAALTLQSVGGRIRVSGEARAPLRARSVSGDVEVRLRRLAAVAVEVETLSGDIRVGYPPGPRPGVDVTPGAGGFEADFALPPAAPGEAGRVRALEEGRALLRLRTQRGRIRVRALTEADQEPEGGREGEEAATASEKT